MVNKVILIGNLGADPELKYTQSGKAVVSMRIATSSRRKNSVGEYENHTTWHSVVVFGKQAESAGQFLHKGSKVFVDGRIEYREYTDKSDIKRYVTEIIAFDVKFLDPRGGGRSEARGEAPGGGQAAQGQMDMGGAGKPADPDDDLPF